MLPLFILATYPFESNRKEAAKAPRPRRLGTRSPAAAVPELRPARSLRKHLEQEPRQRIALARLQLSLPLVRHNLQHPAAAHTRPWPAEPNAQPSQPNFQSKINLHINSNINCVFDLCLFLNKTIEDKSESEAL